ncbi:hypothetical protein AYI70_g9532 [Smittium culicis]|uniref:Uncharacterized protein n=1 Tax=Smittium culicis TaxID=133412 RepID=A0A1R1XAS5_9FUNG|nr:hypothetical protein AYI70_g9532 [Smittium culicis]
MDTCLNGNSYSESRDCLERCGKTAQVPAIPFNSSVQGYKVLSGNFNDDKRKENKSDAQKDSNKDGGKVNSGDIQIPFLEVPNSAGDTYNSQKPQVTPNKITSIPIPVNESNDINKDNSPKDSGKSDLDNNAKDEDKSSTAAYPTETILKANNAKNIRGKAVGAELEAPVKNSSITHTKSMSSKGTSKLTNYKCTFFMVIFVILTF